MGSPLYYASYDGHIDAVRLLLEHGAIIEPYPLMHALIMKHYDVARLLIEWGMDMCYAFENTYRNKFMRGIIEHGQYDLVEHALDHIDVDDRIGNYGATMLMIAAEHDRLVIVRLLLDREADLNLMDNENRKAIHFAANSCANEVLQLLLERGADSSETDGSFRSPLYYAIKLDNVEAVKMLIDHNVAPERIHRLDRSNMVDPSYMDISKICTTNETIMDMLLAHYKKGSKHLIQKN